MTMAHVTMAHVPARERGAALLAVLAMVMLLSGFASLGLSRLRAASDRVVSSEARSEAQLLASAGTTAAVAIIQPLKARAGRRPDILQAPIPLPMGGGRVILRFSDAGACFNLNSLSVPQGRSGMATAVAQARPQDFARLLSAAGIPLLEADAIAKSTAARLSATGQLWADASEWVTVPGVTQAHWAAAGQLLCALPNREASAININSLTPEKAPLLVAMGLGPDEARRALAGRPREGWTSANDFWQQTSSAGVPESAGAQVVGTSSRWIALDLVAETPRARVRRTVLLDTVRSPARVVGSIWQAVEMAA